MKNKFLIFMATITFFLTVAVVGILLKPELYESKTTVIKENDSMQSEVDEKNIESEVSNQEEWGSGDVYDGSSPIIRKMGEKLSVIGIPHRKQGDKPPMSTEVFAYWEGEMVFTVDSAVIYDSIEKTGLNYDEFVVDFSTYDSSFKPMVVQLTIENVNARLISDPPELFSDQYVLSSKEEFSKEKFRSQNLANIFYSEPFAFMIIFILIPGLFCGLWADLSMCLSFFIKNKFFVVIIPYLFLFFEKAFFDSLFSNRIALDLSPFYFMRGESSGNIVIVTIILITMLGVTLFITWFRGWRDDVY